MAAFTVPLTLRRRTSRRRSALEYLFMAAVTMVVFVLALLAIERITNTPLVSRLFEGTIGARTRADYSATFSPRIAPVRSSVIKSQPTATVGLSR